MSLKITICDVTVRERVVELPDNCTKCGIALREARLTGWEYQDQSRPVVVRDDDLTIDYDEEGANVPEGGEAFISYVTLVCQCGEFLVEGDMKWNEPPEPARLDEDRTAKPKTRLVGHVKAGERVGPGLVQPDAIEDTTTGERTSLLDEKRYTVRETGSRQIVAGLENVTADNANVMRLVPTVPLGDLELHDKTLARRNGEVYEIIRVQ